MALIALRQLLDHAAEHGYGVPVESIRAEPLDAIARRYVTVGAGPWSTRTDCG